MIMSASTVTTTSTASWLLSAPAVTCDCEPAAVQRAGAGTWDYGDRTGGRLTSGQSAAAPRGGELPVVAD